jgi:SAM-dependent methyltransferase
MVETARRLNNRANCSFEVNPHPDLRQFADRRFDLVCSFITLQHISNRPAIERFIGELVRITASGGVTAFQLLSSVPLRVRAHPRRHVYRLARDLGVPATTLYRLGLYSMALTAIPRQRVEQVIEANGGVLLGAYPDGRSGSDLIPSLSYYTTRP